MTRVSKKTKLRTADDIGIRKRDLIDDLYRLEGGKFGGSQMDAIVLKIAAYAQVEAVLRGE